MKRAQLRRRVGQLWPIVLVPLPIERDLTVVPVARMTSDEMRRELCKLSGVENGDIIGAAEVSTRDAAAAGLADEAAAFQRMADEMRAVDVAAASRRFVDPLRDGYHAGPDDEAPAEEDR